MKDEHIITINKIELASELAREKLIENWQDEVFKDENSEVLEYTEKAQDIFNLLYDDYLTLIEKTKQ